MARRKARPKQLSAASVMRILDSEDPIGELREYLAVKGGIASIEAGQVALGAAQLLLLDARPADEVAAILDLVLDYWDALPDPIGFHTREFLRNALAAVGDDPARISRLLERIPEDPDAELRESLDTLAVAPHLPRIRAALDRAIEAVRDFDGVVVLNPPASLDAIRAAERACHISLPDDYRALLSLHDGLRLWDESFLGTLDFTTATDLSARAGDFLDGATRAGSEHLIPLSNRGTHSWLLYDPRGAYRRGPGYVLRVESGSDPQRGLVEFLEHLAAGAREIVSKLN